MEHIRQLSGLLGRPLLVSYYGLSEVAGKFHGQRTDREQAVNHIVLEIPAAFSGYLVLDTSLVIASKVVCMGLSTHCLLNVTSTVVCCALVLFQRLFLAFRRE